MRRLGCTLGLVTILALVGCTDRSEIVLSIDTTLGIPCDIDKLRIRAVGSKNNTLVRELGSGVRLPIKITLEDDTTNGGFELEVSGLKGNQEVLRAAGMLTFGSGEPLGSHVVLESTCTPTAPCQLSELAPYKSPPAPVAARAACGENVRRYVPSPTAETYRDACTVPGMNSGRVLNDGKRGAALLPIPAAALAGFSFEFYGRPIRQIWAHEDGYISFGPDNPDALNDLDPGAFDRDLLGIGVPPPKQSVMVFWDALTLSSNGVCYALEGSPGTQKLRVTWARTCQSVACTTDNLNFTIVLDERNNRIAFTYGDMIAANAERAQGATATVGLVNQANGCPVAQCTLATGLCSDGTTPCGYSQVFSNMPQAPRIENVQFDPVVSPR